MKRPSIISDLGITPLQHRNAVASPPDQPATVKPAAPPADLVRSSIYLSRSSHDRLREIAFAERKKIHDLIVEGIDDVIAKRGHCETARRKSHA